MSKATVRSGWSTWAGSAHPSLTHPADKYMRLDNGEMETFLYLNHAVPRGATVLSATLRLYARNASTGSRTLTVRRIGSSWTLSRLTWNHKPSATGASATKAISTLADKSVVDIDVTVLVQALADGAPNYGFKIATSTSTAHYFYGMLSAYKPTLIVEWSDRPATPTRLSPAGTTSLAKPMLVFDYLDVGGNTTLSAVQVQIDPAASTTSPAFDSGTVLTSEPELNLAATAYAGLADGGTTQWRVRVQDGAGLWSDWSQWTTFSRASKGTVTISNPSGGVLYDTTPPIIWSFSGTQTAYRVHVLDDEGFLIHSSGKITSTDVSYTIPPGLSGSAIGGNGERIGLLNFGENYTVAVQIWDTNTNRVATPGDPTYAEATAAFTINRDLTTSGPSALTAAVQTGTPWIELDFTRSTAPDSWTIVRDGKVVDSLVDPADVLVSGTSYKYLDYTASPNRAHVYEVIAVVNSKSSHGNPTATVTPEVSGVWIGDPDRDLSVGLWGDDPGTFAGEDDAAVYRPVGSTSYVRVVQGMSGLTGSLTLYMIEGFGRTFDDLEADLYSMKERPSETYRLVLGDVNIPATVGDIVIAPTPITRKGRLVKAVTFNFWQRGELAFRPRL